MQQQNNDSIEPGSTTLKRKQILAAVAAAVSVLISDDSSSDSDEDFAIILAKTYLQNEAKRKRVHEGSAVDTGVETESDSEVSENVTLPDTPGPLNQSIKCIGPGLASSTSEKNDSSLSAQTPELSVQTPECQDGSVVPQSITDCRLSSAEFKNFFKLTRTSVEMILRLVGVSCGSRTGRPRMSLEKNILLFLWILVSRESFPNLSARFGCSKTTTYQAFFYFSQALQNTKDLAITWPTGAKASKKLWHVESSVSEACSVFPGTFGCLGTVHLKVPVNDRIAMFQRNRHGYPSVVFQAVCDTSGRFIDTDTTCLGANSDAQVWKKSRIYAKLKSSPSLLPKDSHLLGHDFYPLSADLMIPYADDGKLDDRQTKYNSLLKKQRNVLETSFTKLIRCFKRLQFLDIRYLEKARYFVNAACICYNVMLSEGNDDVENDDGDEFNPLQLAVGQFHKSGSDTELDAEAVTKRDGLAQVISLTENITDTANMEGGNDQCTLIISNIVSLYNIKREPTN